MISVIANPVAGKGRVAKTLPRLKAALTDLGIRAELRLTERPGHGGILAQEALKKDPEIVVAVGGDGTAHEVGTALIGTEVPFHIIPLGSGNDYSRALHGNISWKQALQKLLSPAFRKVDTGVLYTSEGRFPFLNGMGFGFDAFVVRNLYRFPYLKGDLLYLATVIWAFFHFRGVPAQIGDFFQGEILLFNAGIGQYLGGGFKLFPLARLADHLLDLSIIESVSIPKFIAYLPLVILGKHLGLKEVTYTQQQEVDFRFGVPLDGQLEGELLPAPVREGHIEILPESLVVLT